MSCSNERYAGHMVPKCTTDNEMEEKRTATVRITLSGASYSLAMTHLTHQHCCGTKQSIGSMPSGRPNALRVNDIQSSLNSLRMEVFEVL